MSRQKIEVKYRIGVERPTPLFCGAGVGTSSVDRTFVRDEQGRIVVRGSHMKGVVRQQCEDLLAAVGHECPDPHIPEAVEGVDNLVTRLFGLPGAKDIRCVFSDATFLDGDPVVQSRMRVRRDRRLGRPVPRALFSTEHPVLLPGESLEGQAVFWVEGHQRVPPELTLLCAGLKLVQHIGGSKSSGAGAVSVEILKITTGGGDVSLATALAPVGEAGWPDGVGGAS